MLREQYDRLEADAAEFFADAQTDRAAPKAFQKASFQTFCTDRLELVR
jgi:hypothetical protein